MRTLHQEDGRLSIPQSSKGAHTETVERSISHVAPKWCTCGGASTPQSRSAKVKEEAGGGKKCCKKVLQPICPHTCGRVVMWQQDVGCPAWGLLCQNSHRHQGTRHSRNTSHSRSTNTIGLHHDCSTAAGPDAACCWATGSAPRPPDAVGCAPMQQRQSSPQGELPLERTIHTRRDGKTLTTLTPCCTLTHGVSGHICSQRCSGWVSA